MLMFPGCRGSQCSAPIHPPGPSLARGTLSVSESVIFKNILGPSGVVRGGRMSCLTTESSSLGASPPGPRGLILELPFFFFEASEGVQGHSVISAKCMSAAGGSHAQPHPGRHEMGEMRQVYTCPRQHLGRAMRASKAMALV